MSKIVKLEIDWAEEFGWQCPLCGGEIDHDHEDDSDEYTDDSYQCQDKNGSLCAKAYFMVRWSNTKTGDDGDALTLERWIEFEV